MTDTRTSAPETAKTEPPEISGSAGPTEKAVTQGRSAANSVRAPRRGCAGHLGRRGRDGSRAAARVVARLRKENAMYIGAGTLLVILIIVLLIILL